MPNTTEEYSSGNHNSNYYPLLVWCFTNLISPLLFCLILLLEGGDPSSGNDFAYIIDIILIGFIFSIPTFAIYLISSWFILPLKIYYLLKKGVLALIALIGLFATFNFLLNDGTLFVKPELNELTISYAATITILSFSFRIKNKAI